MTLKIQGRFKEQAKGVFGKYKFQVGILEDKPHYWPSYGPTSKLAKQSPPKLSKLAGAEVRAIYRGSYRGRRFSNESTAAVSESFRHKTGINYLTKPFEKRSSEIIRFANEFIKLAVGKSEKRRCENLLQAIVRNPLVRQEYGGNSPNTIKRKGFNRLGFDTGQMFKSIIAKCVVRRG